MSYLTIDEVLEVARAGERAGCREALFTLGDKPELRYRAAREELAALGFATTIEYLAAAARAVLEETTLLPHLNPGVLDAADYELLRPVVGLDGDDDRDDRRAALAARRAAFRLARQAAGCAASRRCGSPARRASRSRPGS